MKYPEQLTKCLLYYGIMTLLLISACRKKDSNTVPNKKGQEVKMTSQNFNLESLISRCENADENEIRTISADLSNPSFINSLADQESYNRETAPKNLSKALQSLAKNKNTAAVSNAFLLLSKSPLYAPQEVDNFVRRIALIEESGNMTNPSSAWITFLEQELIKGSVLGTSATQALVQIASNNALVVLLNRIFSPQTTKLQEYEYSIIVSIQTYKLAVKRDRPVVLSFLVNQLFRIPETQAAVLTTISQNKILYNPQEEMAVHLPPLDAETPNSIELAKILTLWLNKNGESLYESDDFPALTKRIPDLLDLEPTQPAGGKSEDIKKWAAELFQQAWQQSDDPQRKEQIQLARSALQ